MLDSLIAAADADLSRPRRRRIKETFAVVYTQTKVTALREDENGVDATFEGQADPAQQRFDTDPQLAWAGLTENAARAQRRSIKIARFPWSASGRALTMDAPEGMTKIIADPETGRVVGFGIVGREAGEMIAEGVLTIEMGALAEDVALTIHARPTLSETEDAVAELFLGSATYILPGKK